MRISLVISFYFFEETKQLSEKIYKNLLFGNLRNNNNFFPRNSVEKKMKRAFRFVAVLFLCAHVNANFNPYDHYTTTIYIPNDLSDCEEECECVCGDAIVLTSAESERLSIATYEAQIQADFDALEECDDGNRTYFAMNPKQLNVTTAEKLNINLKIPSLPVQEIFSTPLRIMSPHYHDVMRNETKMIPLEFRSHFLEVKKPVRSPIGYLFDMIKYH